MLKSIITRINQFIEHSKLSGIIIAFISFIIIALVSMTDTYKMFELKLYDIRCMLKPSIEEWDRLSFVDVDENSTTSIGQFPWPRRIYSEGLRVLKKVGVSQASFDIMFPDASPLEASSENLELVLRKKKQGDVSEDDITGIVIDNDLEFSEGVKTMGDVLLSYTFSSDPLGDEVIKRMKSDAFTQALARFNDRATIVIPEKERYKFSVMDDPDVVAISYPMIDLMNSGNMFGFVNRDTDIDGTVRKVRLIRYYKGRVYFNLSLSMFINICRVDRKNIEIIPGEKIVLKKAIHPKTQIRGDIEIPIDENGMMYVNWAGPGPREKSFHIIPFFALIDYNYYADSVHDFFDAIETRRGKFERSRLYQELEKSEKRYYSARKDEVRIESWKKITGLRRKIAEIKRSYAAELDAEIKRLEGEFEKTGDKKISKDLDILRDDRKAVDLVIRVEDLRDHLTITGLTATGTHDIGVIPIHNEYAGVGTYHNTVNTIYNGRFLSKTGGLIDYFIMLVVALFMGFTVQMLDARKSLLMIGASFIFVNLIIIMLFIIPDVWVSQLGISLALIIPSSIIAGIKFVETESQRRFIKNAFSRYLAPGVIDQIIENPESLELGGENREITIFFSDVAGFSTISEKLTPPELVSLLNEYLSEMTEIILSYGGTVDKYEGDAIMAFYGAPQPYDDHAIRACLASIDMKRRLREMQDEWKKKGEFALSARMGMNTGDAVVGNMGSHTRMDYTAMGDSVNLASRLEGANKFYKTNAMISETTYELAKNDIEARKLDIIRVVGKSEPILVYELLGRKGTLPERMNDMLEHYYSGLEFFSNHQWKRALSCFKKGLAVIPDDGPLLTYCERCENFIKKPPSKNWDGVYTFKSK